MNELNAVPVLEGSVMHVQLHLRQALELLVANKAKISALGVGQCIGLVKKPVGPTLYVNNNSGICDYLNRYNGHFRLGMANEIAGVFKDVMATWGFYTGSRLYPIPMSTDYQSGNHAEEQYDHCLDHESNMYYHDNEYGQLRWEAIEYVLEQLAKEPELSI